MTTSAEISITCSNPECNFAVDGRCIEGMEFDACPHYGKTLEEQPNPEIDIKDIEVPEGIITSNAEALLTSELAKFLCQYSSRIIAIVGPSDAGKTSLIASVYDLFQEGPVKGHRFSRSATLHAFEFICHDSRAESQRGVPHTQRTKRGEVKYFHLEIGLNSSEESVGVFLADRAGEEYKDVNDDSDLALSFPELSRADTLTILVDGKKLLNTGARHNLHAQIMMMLQAFVESGSLTEGHRLALVLTKIDAVNESEFSERAERDFEILQNKVRENFSEVFAIVETFKIAASPASVDVARGSGVAELFDFWTQNSTKERLKYIPVSQSARAFAQLRSREENE